MNVYKFAEVPVGIEFRGKYFEKKSREYLADGETPKFCISVNLQDLMYEQEHAEDNTRYPQDYLEYIAIYRKFCEKVLDYGVVLCHGSVVEYKGKAYMFTAPSGTGKSTHARLWRENFGEDVIMINDDKPLLKFKEDGVYAYGTPWDGKHCLSTNRCAKLAGICFLYQAETNHIERIGADKSVELLMNQIYRPQDAKAILKTLDYGDMLLKEVPMYSMGCNISKEAAQMAYDAMKNE